MISKRKGIILAGGHATRLRPATLAVSKQMLPIYDKPMIYYPLSTLMLIGIKDILIISDPININSFRSLLGNGKEYGISLTYTTQKEPRGLADAFIVGEKFLKNSKSVLILGDNIFYGSNLVNIVKNADTKPGCTIFGYPVKDPERYGVVKLNKKKFIVDILEKPKKAPTNLAIPGLYFYDENAPKIAKKIVPSKRGEIEITDLNKHYLKNNKMNFIELNRGITWLDTGTFDSYYEACEFVKVIQKRQGLLICSPEQIAFRNCWINKKKLIQISKKYPNDYGKSLRLI